MGRVCFGTALACAIWRNTIRGTTRKRPVSRSSRRGRTPIAAGCTTPFGRRVGYRHRRAWLLTEKPDDQTEDRHKKRPGTDSQQPGGNASWPLVSWNGLAKDEIVALGEVSSSLIAHSPECLRFSPSYAALPS